MIGHVCTYGAVAVDTSRDYRILIAEDALHRLESRVKSWGLPYPLNRGVAESLLSRARSLLMSIKYSYLPLNYLLSSPQLKELAGTARELSKYLLPPPNFRVEGTSSKLAVAEIKYSLLALIGLKARLALGEENLPEYGVDVVGVEVVTVSRHSSADRLWVLKVGTEKFSLTVVTNIPNVKKGEVRAVAILPPKNLYGVISEAMIVSDPIPTEFKGRRPPSDLLHLKELRTVVESIVKGR